MLIVGSFSFSLFYVIMLSFFPYCSTFLFSTFSLSYMLIFYFFFSFICVFFLIYVYCSTCSFLTLCSFSTCSHSACSFFTLSCSSTCSFPIPFLCCTLFYFVCRFPLKIFVLKLCTYFPSIRPSVLSLIRP